ncbi:hypothetical protein C7N43_08140 [Sphingobacteriales bacterium UPWRP_1]|nr:hypothetical protein B6N25_11075 [Sphingobacteriales bacterium TSM_CSS]PSJ77525.1 hypothetical protein C7N43_08140 [Sphingobacteriales bacterium UPWRP_1]
MKNLLIAILMFVSLFAGAQNAPKTPVPPQAPLPPDAAQPVLPPAPPAQPGQPDTTTIKIGKSIQIKVVDKDKKEKPDAEEQTYRIDVETDNDELGEEIERAVREALQGLNNVEVELDIDHKEIARQMQRAQEEIGRAQKELAEQMRRLNEDEQGRQNEEAKRELENARRELEDAQREIEQEMRELQREMEDDKQIQINIGKEKHEMPEAKAQHKFPRIKTRWVLFDMGVSTYMNNGSFNMPLELENFDQRYGRSLNYQLHVFRQRVGLVKNNVNLLYGLGFDFSNYSFENPITLLKNSNPLEVTIDNAIDYKKNKLVTTALNIPLMLNFETNPRRPGKSFRLSAGVYGGLLIGSHTRQKSEELGNNKERDDYNLNKLRYGFVGQIGVGPINFYANYSPQSLFRDGRGPDLQPFNVGLSIIPF